MFHYITDLLGVELQTVSHKERIISGLGALIGILVVCSISSIFTDKQGTFMVIASMGASAVLLFAVPHGALSQPWPLIGGHLLSTVIGVTCARYLENPLVAAPVAVGVSVTAMYYARCIHPPGGASALTAVVGGSSISELGYQFVITPVLLNTISILMVAVLFNGLFEWRRYPVHIDKLRKRKKPQPKLQSVDSPASAIRHEDFVYALSEMNTFIDIDESDLIRIYELATKKHLNSLDSHLQIKKDHYYSNGEFGIEWSVRRITDFDQDKDRILYETVAGRGRRKKGVCSTPEFRNWALYEVYRDEDNWRKVDHKIDNVHSV